MYESFSKRKIIEMIDERKLALVAALHANGMIENLGQEISNLEQASEEAKALIYNNDTKTKADIDFETNPFYTAGWKVPEIESPNVSDIESTDTDQQ